MHILPNVALMGGILVTLTACEKDSLDLNAELTMQYQAIEVILDPMEATGQVELAVDFNGREAIEEALASNGMDLSNLRQVRVLAAKIAIVEPAAATFAPLNAFSLQLGHTGNGFQTIAATQQVDAYATELHLSMSGDDLVQYFMSDGVAIKVALDLGMPITETMKFQVDLTFRIVAGTN